MKLEICLLLTLCCVMLTSGQILSTEQTTDSANRNYGLFDALISPLRSTFSHARNLFGQHNPMGGVNNFVHDRFDRLQERTFRIFMQLYNKTYSPSEMPRRMKLFFDRRKQIEESIRAYSAGQVPFFMRENPYIDWDERELKALTGVSPPKSINELTPEEHDVIFGGQSSSQPNHREYYEIEDEGIKQQRPLIVSRSLLNGIEDKDDAGLIVKAKQVYVPARKDWRESGCVARPVNQEKCGCCYALATIGVLETMRCIYKVSSPILSSQQIIDCATPRAGYENYGCDGGWPTRVLRYLQDKGVVARETCYPLILRQESCKLNRVSATPGCTMSASPTGASRLRYKVLNNEQDILYHVAMTGPVVTVMRTTNKFLYYGSGIFDDLTCSRAADDVDHAIQIVGYGRENGINYWLIKNSWGTEWGINGYAKYKRGTNACSIGHWGWVIPQ